MTKQDSSSYSKIILILLLTCGITACQPPISGQAASWKKPFLYWQLKNEQLKPTLHFPVQGVSIQQTNDTWGAARSNNRQHQGIDIFAKRGTPIESATHGLVRKVGIDNLGGRVVWVTGPNLSQHYYAHLNEYADDIQVGDWVEAGEVLGFVGNSGNAKTTPPHLHYGIYLKGQGAVNPYPYLK